MSLFQASQNAKVPLNTLIAFNKDLQHSIRSLDEINIPDISDVVRVRIGIPVLLCSPQGDIVGEITISPYHLLFGETGYAIDSPFQLKIPLISIVNLKVFPHERNSRFEIIRENAPEDLVYLAVHYLQDPNSGLTADVIFFSGMRCDLESVAFIATQMSREIKTNLSYRSPLTIQFGPVFPSLHECAYESRILGNDELEQLIFCLPINLRRKQLAKVFSTEVNGICLETFYSKASTTRECLLLVLTSLGPIGVFLPFPLSRGSSTITGSGSFVFSAINGLRVYKLSVPSVGFVSGGVDALMIGRPNPALMIDEFLTNGSSCECETFQSPALTPKRNFEIVSVELWMFVL